MSSRSLLNNVQALRAIAAYMVVLYHVRLLTPLTSDASFAFGNAGVDVFFFISGFIINHVSVKTDVGRPGAFLTKRIIRIVPLYWLLTVAVAAAGTVAPGFAGSGGAPTLARLAKSLFFVPYFDDTGEAHPILFMGWTLNYEMFFYLVFAAALLLRDEVRRLLSVSAVLVALVLVGFAAAPTDAAGTTYTSPLLLEFVIGMWMNRIFRLTSHRPVLATARAMLLLAIGAALAVLAIGDAMWPAVPREIKWGIPAFVIVASALALERGEVVVRSRLVLLLGEASYAIYLIHPFIIKAASIVYSRLNVTSAALHFGAILSVLAAVGLIGIAFHLFVERPIIAWLRHRLTPRAAASAPTGDLPPDTSARV